MNMRLGAILATDAPRGELAVSCCALRASRAGGLTGRVAGNGTSRKVLSEATGPKFSSERIESASHGPDQKAKRFREERSVG